MTDDVIGKIEQLSSEGKTVMQIPAMKKGENLFIKTDDIAKPWGMGGCEVEYLCCVAEGGRLVFCVMPNGDVIFHGNLMITGEEIVRAVDKFREGIENDK